MVIKRCGYKGLHILKKGLSWLRPQEKSSFWSPEDVIKARSLELTAAIYAENHLLVSL